MSSPARAEGVAILRLFVAAYPHPELAAELDLHLRACPHAPGRNVPAEQIHLTLQFIGDRAERELPATIESVERACAGLADLSVEMDRVTPWPPDRRTMIVARGAASAGVLELHRRLAHRLSRDSRREPPDRFEAHLTLRRLQPGHSLEPFERTFGPVTMAIREVHLVKSVLRPSGAVHEAVRVVSID